MPASAAKNACDLLDADHLAVKHLFVEYARLAHLPAEAGGDRRAVAQRICDQLTAHAQIEEEIFYPALQRAVPETADVLQEATAEHQQAKDMIARLRAMDAADVSMDELVSQLACAIEHHVKEERDELFPKAKTAPGMDLFALGEQLREQQEALAAGEA